MQTDGHNRVYRIHAFNVNIITNARLLVTLHCSESGGIMNVANAEICFVVILMQRIYM